MMALSPWRRWFGLAPTPDDADESRRRDETSHQLRHDYANVLNTLSVKTEEARRAMDVIDAQIDYLRATGRHWRNDDAQPKGDAAGGPVRGGDPGDV